MRIFAVSDVHVDYEENRRWVSGLSSQDYQHDCLIVAGDLSDDLLRLSQCLDTLVRKFYRVFFIPGNHDVWVNRSAPFCSVEKFDHVLQLANECGAVTRSASIGSYTFVPIHSWYDFSFGEPSEYIKSAWMDFKRCRWPDNIAHPRDIVEHFFSYNTTPEIDSNNTVISFSHFLPRIDVMPSFIPTSKREIYPVLGSSEIDRWVRALPADIHVYGHSHVNRSVSIDGVRYVNNAFGYPNEGRIARKALLNVLEA